MLGSAKYIVGTPPKIVQRSLLDRVDDRLGLEARDERQACRRSATEMLSTLDSPKTWNNGSTATPMSSSLRTRTARRRPCSSCTAGSG